MPRRYQHTIELLPQIREMLARGMTQKEVAEELGLAGKKSVHDLLTRENRKQKRMEAGIMPRPKGRPHKYAAPRDIVEAQAYEIRRLKMENELLRDFLSLAGKE